MYAQHSDVLDYVAGAGEPGSSERDAIGRTPPRWVAMMDAAVLTEPGAPRFATFTEPVSTDSQLVLDVIVAGLNPVDIAIAAGQVAGSTRQFPYVAGHEGVGIVGGRRVYFSGPSAPFGAMAQRTLISPDRLLDVPAGLDDGQAVALGTSGLAAWLALSWRARMQPGETVLVLGATGAVGSVAVQAARLLGAGRVVAAGRDIHGLTLAGLRGADAVVDVDFAEDLPADFRRAAGGPIDVVIDPVWGDTAIAALSVAAPWSRHVQIGNSASQISGVPAAALRRASGAILGYSNLMVPAAVRRAAYLDMAGHAAAGRLSVEVDHHPLRDVRAVWQRQQAFPHRKLVLVP